MQTAKERRQSDQLISSINVTGFLSVMMVLPYLVMGPYMWVKDGHGGDVDLAKVNHPVSMPGARREDAIVVGITRDGKVYFGSQEVELSQLPAKLRDAVKSGAPPIVYFKADGRARYRYVRDVLDAARTSGVEKIGFLVEQRGNERSQ